MYAGMSTIPQQAILKTASLPALRLNPFLKIGFVLSVESEKTSSLKPKFKKICIQMQIFLRICENIVALQPQVGLA